MFAHRPEGGGQVSEGRFPEGFGPGGGGGTEARLRPRTQTGRCLVKWVDRRIGKLAARGELKSRLGTARSDGDKILHVRLWKVG